MMKKRWSVGRLTGALAMATTLSVLTLGSAQADTASERGDRERSQYGQVGPGSYGEKRDSAERKGEKRQGMQRGARGSGRADERPVPGPYGGGYGRGMMQSESMGPGYYGPQRPGYGPGPGYGYGPGHGHGYGHGYGPGHGHGHGYGHGYGPGHGHGYGYGSGYGQGGHYPGPGSMYPQRMQESEADREARIRAIERAREVYREEMQRHRDSQED